MEETVVRTLDCIPPERGAVWVPEANMVLVSSQLSETERQAAIAELSVRWRRSMLRLVV